MQLKGLVRFFTILLIIYSLYQLSFTWFVRNHEKKMENIALNNVHAAFPETRSQKIDDYSAVAKEYYDNRLKRLLDSTKTKTVSYGINGPVSYQKAKEEELNLGLDLQGGMSVTMEVEMTGMLKSLASGSKDPQFLKALDSATNLKKNSSANFITLFKDAYQGIAGKDKMSGLFATARKEQIKVGDNDEKVIGVLRTEAGVAFDNTYRILKSRIDQFGVAQPNINPEPSRGIITVELPGVKDKERVRKLLQSSANLQFWETYRMNVVSASLNNIDAVFDNFTKGINPADTTKPGDTTGTKPVTAAPVVDTTQKVTKLSDLDKTPTNDTGKTPAKQTAAADKNSIFKYILPVGDQTVGLVGFQVNVNDTAIVREYLNSEALRRYLPPNAILAYGIPTDAKNKKILPVYFLKPINDRAAMQGDVVTEAKQDFNPLDGKPTVTLKMNNAGQRIWEALTERSSNATTGFPIAIEVDNIVYSAPGAREKISGGNTEISGSFTIEEAKDLANILKLGRLEAPAKIVQDEQVGATLGKDAIRGGSMAFIISFIVIFLLMLIYYNTAGWIANIALILNLLFTIGVLAGLGATLTAPGIAGLVLTIGMAVDTNVIIYERIKEELTKGKGYIPAINEGYKRSLPPVIDAHVTTFLTALLLFTYFQTGPIRGFATTQMLGIVLSLFCGILVSRWVTDWFTSKNKHLEYFTNVSRRVFKHAKFKFIEYRKYAYMISVVVALLGIGSYFNGFKEGVEFSGGRQYKVKFDKSVDVEKIRDELKLAFEGENPVIKTVGDNQTLEITTSYLINTPGQEIDSLVREKMLGGLKAHGKPEVQSSSTVLPTIADDIKKNSVNATLLALLVIFIYILIRFRDWRYSLGTIVALLHDVFITLAVFSFLKNVVPFPLEIDQHFIAAVLTVIGFSMNDTVIVFDRIREYSHVYKGESRGSIINRAINDTLSRTIMTSLTVFLTILILFLVGGEVTRGFAFAMLIGVITGTYSSIFVAAPILVDIGKNKPLGESAPGKTVVKK
ncbi:MAG: protein translocase subunit SecDF [Bacteroidetes bacterium]|nr:MAG: protein translocase subunit SecDF [Bacteroidota bacterium]